MTLRQSPLAPLRHCALASISLATPHMSANDRKCPQKQKIPAFIPSLPKGLPFEGKGNQMRHAPAFPEGESSQRMLI